MAAAAERGVDVDAVRRGSPARRRLLRAGRGRGRHRPSKARSRRAPAAGRRRERDRARRLLVPLRLVPQLELVALPDQHDVLVERRVLRAARAARGCGPRRRCSTSSAWPTSSRCRPRISSLNDDSAMSRAWIGSHVGERIDEQAAAGIGGDHRAGRRLGGRRAPRGAAPGMARRPLASSASWVTPRNDDGRPPSPLVVVIPAASATNRSSLAREVSAHLQSPCRAG